MLWCRIIITNNYKDYRLLLGAQVIKPSKVRTMPDRDNKVQRNKERKPLAEDVSAGFSFQLLF